MVWLKRLAGGLAGVLLAVALLLGIYVVRSFPALNGAVLAPGLQHRVSVARDASDVTHIHAASSHDA